MVRDQWPVVSATLGSPPCLRRGIWVAVSIAGSGVLGPAPLSTASCRRIRRRRPRDRPAGRTTRARAVAAATSTPSAPQQPELAGRQPFPEGLSLSVLLFHGFVSLCRRCGSYWSVPPRRSAPPLLIPKDGWQQSAAVAGLVVLAATRYRVALSLRRAKQSPAASTCGPAVSSIVCFLA